MITKITGEQPFQVLTNNFSISPSNEGYTLQISADGKNFSNLFTVGAGVTRLVTGVAANSYYRLSGNQSQVSVNWMKTCVTEGGGAAGNELIPQESLPATADAGTVVALTNGGVYQYDGSDWNAVGGADIAPLSAAVETLSAATEGKADAASVSANTEDYVFPIWNEQGIITGKKATVKTGQFNINGSTQKHIIGNNDRTINIYAPTTTGVTGQISVLTNSYTAGWATPTTINGSAITAGGNVYAPVSAGTAGDILVSTGNGAPVWSGVTIPENPVQSLSIDTIWKGTQAEYDAITTKDPNTFYIIVAN